MAIIIKEVNYSEYHDIIKEINQGIYGEELNYLNSEYKEDIYDKHSSHFLAIDNGNYVGYTRIIKPNPHGLPALEIAEVSNNIDLSKSIEVSKLMVRKEYRKISSKIGFSMMQNAFAFIIKNRFHDIIVDIFIESDFKTYELCLVFGFKEISKKYNDKRYKDNMPSIILAANIPDAINTYRLYKYLLENTLDDTDLDNYMLDYMKDKEFN